MSNASDTLGLMEFTEGYFHRIWGGRKLETMYNKALPTGETIGEAWLIADHPRCVSEVRCGPQAGQSLRNLLEGPLRDALLGARAKLTRHDRFPLLLKLIDAHQDLSVQVHPDDDKALALEEPDGGKTEMWHVLHADPGSSLICGLKESVTPESFKQAVADKTVQDQMKRFEAPENTVVFVPSRTVHALGKGFVITEIQQNSDLTYRIYDWDRRDESGKPRELHLDKALAVTDFDTPHGGPNTPLAYNVPGGQVNVEAACRYFVSEWLKVLGDCPRDTQGASFHILLGLHNELLVELGDDKRPLAPGNAMLVPGAAGAYTLHGEGECLAFYVPDLIHDVVAPLLKAGHSRDMIIALGGTAPDNDVARAMADSPSQS